MAPNKWNKACGHFFLEKLPKLKILRPQDIIMNYFTKNYGDPGIFEAMRPQLIYFLVPIHFLKFSAVNLWTALTCRIWKLQKSYAYFWIQKFRNSSIHILYFSFWNSSQKVENCDLCTGEVFFQHPLSTITQFSVAIRAKICGAGQF